MVFPWFYHMLSGYTMEIPMLFPRNSRIPRKASAPTPSTEPRLMAWPATTAGLCLGLAEESSETAPQSTPCVLSLCIYIHIHIYIYTYIYIYIVIIIMIYIIITYYYYYNYLYTIIIAIIITITKNYYHWYYCCYCYYHYYYYYYYYICYYRYYFYYYYSCDYCYYYWCCCCCYCYYEILIDILLKMMPYSNFFDAEIREEKGGEGLEGG